MQDWPSIVGTHIRRYRTSRGFTQEELALSAEIDVTYLRGIEAGRRNPSLLVMASLANALEIKLADLVRS